jgi:hypothetical protein
MPRLKLTSAVVCLIIAACLVGRTIWPRKKALEIEHQMERGLGQVVAEETAKLLANHGQILVVSFDGAIGSEQMGAFTEALQHAGGVQVIGHEHITPVAFAEDEAGFPVDFARDHFAALVAKFPNVDAFVGFGGFPNFTAADLQTQSGRTLKLVSVLAPPRGAKSLLERGLIQLAIVPRFQPLSLAASSPKTPREWFARYYQVATTSDAPNLPE